MPERNFHDSEFYLKRNLDLNLFLHSPGLEIWLLYFTFPFPVTTERLQPASDDFTSGVDIHLSKSIRTCKDCGDCTMYSSLEWSTCTQESLTREFQEKLPCKVSYFHHLNLPDLQPCPNKGMSWKASTKARKIVWSYWNGTESPCRRPCQNPSIKSYTTKYPRNTGLLDDDESFQLLIYYDYLTVDEEVEYYVYGGEKFVSAVGGVMGLCLGYSLLSIFLSIVDSIKIRYS